MSGRRHPASLIPICLHNPLLVQLMAGSVNLPMISYVARQYSDIIRKDGEPLASEDGPSPLISLDKFIIRLVVASNVQVSTLLTTLIYLDRLKSGLSPETRVVLPCTRHRLFLATLIITAKYLNDSSPKNGDWAKYASLFDVAEVNLMEMQLLYLLDYDLWFDEAEACSLLAPFLSSISRWKQDSSTRALAVDKVTKAGRARAQAQRAQNQSVLRSRPPPALSAQLSATSRASSSVSLAVRGIVKRLSTTHLTSNRGPTSAMHATLSHGSSASSSSSSSDMASLLEDTGSSSSSGWTSNDSCSDCSEDENGNDGILRAYSVDEDIADTTITMTASQALSLSKAAIGTKRSFKLRPFSPASAYKSAHRRGRKASDTSSITTVIASPILPAATTSSSTSFLFPLRGPASRQQLLRRDSKRVASATPDISCRAEITESSTEPSISRSVSATLSTSSTGNFLSRMWVAATTVKTQSVEQHADQPQVPGALRRLVLAHSRSSMFNRTNGGQASHPIEV